MSEQKRTAIPKYDAIVNICSMPPPMAEEVVSYAHKAAKYVRYTPYTCFLRLIWTFMHY